MKFQKRFVVADNERALLFREGRFEKLLNPGVHKFWDFQDQLKAERYDLAEVEFRHKKSKVLLIHQELQDQILVVKGEMDQVSLVYKDSALIRLVLPGQELMYWKDAAKIEVKTFNVSNDVHIPEKIMQQIVEAGLEKQGYKIRALHAVIAEEHVGLRFENGKLVEELKPGRYGFWATGKSQHVDSIDMRLQTSEVAAQEILTRDKVSTRYNLIASYRIKDAKTFVTKIFKGKDVIYQVLQLALREAVGTRSLDALLEDKQAIAKIVAVESRSRLEAMGVELEQVGVKDIILPGDMKDILNQVVQAQKSAEANVIKRREETAATRSLHNTAKVMENNPVLLRLKELEALEKISERVEKIQVVGGLEQVLNMSNLLTK